MSDRTNLNLYLFAKIGIIWQTAKQFQDIFHKSLYIDKHVIALRV